MDFCERFRIYRLKQHLLKITKLNVVITNTQKTQSYLSIPSSTNLEIKKKISLIMDMGGGKRANEITS